MDKETLKSLMPPEAFTRKNVARGDAISVGELQRIQLEKLLEVLAQSELEDLIEEGKITLGLIKPNAYEGKNLPENDALAADYLLDKIRDHVAFSFSTRINRDEAEEFYQPIKEQYSQRPSEKDPGISIWESTIAFTISGPITFVLIYDENGKAIEWWREKMGNTYADRANSDSIRGQHAIRDNLPNNLVHGSDGKGSVRREINVLISHLKRIVVD